MTLKEQYKKVELLKAQLEKLLPLKPHDEQRLWKKFRLEWNFNSNHMEGNTLTYGHTELLLFFDKVSGDYTGREIEEMKAHDVAIKMVMELAKDKERDLTENFIRELNQIILVRPFWKEAETPDGQMTRREITPGEYKRYPNSVRLENGEMFNYAMPEETPAMMGDLMNFYTSSVADSSIHPLWLAAMMHYKFVRIHPFDDGNGRVARLLMNYILLKNGYPSVIIKDSGKKDYLMALNKADIGDLNAFALYLGKQLQWSLEISIRAAQGESIDEEGDLDKKIKLLKRKHNVPDKIIVKSKKVIDDVIRKVYIGFLVQIDANFLHFKELFKFYKWSYKSETKDELERHIRPFLDSNLANIIKIYDGFATKGSENKYETKYSLIRFNDEDDSFSVYVICDIEFNEKSFDIKIQIGAEKRDSEIARIVSEYLNDLFNKYNKEFEFSKNKYSSVYSDDIIKAWVKDVSEKLYELIEIHANELEQRRKKPE